MFKRFVIATAALFLAPLSFAADTYGIFETIRESAVSFSETTAAVDVALADSELVLQGSHDVRVPDDKHQAKVYVLTSPAYAAVTDG